MNTELSQVQEAVAFIESKINGFKPTSGIVLGTGLSGLVGELEIETEIDYSDIPHFPVSTVEFHKGKLVFGKLNGANVVVMQGRFHYYEGYSMKQVVFPIRVMKFLGIDQLLISNAAGGIDPKLAKSDLMIITDHINLMGENPLVGAHTPEFGDRWPDMFEAYNNGLIVKAKTAAKELNIDIKEGVYSSVSGPNLETPAEYKYLKVIGADAVGMSTVPEVIAGVQMGLKVFAMSVITDLCYPSALGPVSIEHIIAAAGKAEPNMIAIFSELVA